MEWNAESLYLYASAGKNRRVLKYRSIAKACLKLVLSRMPSRLIAVVLLGLVVASASGQGESLANKNKDDIVKHEDILKDKVATDLQELKTKIKQFVENVNSKLTELRTKTKEAIEKLQEDTAANMKTGDTTIKENIKKLEEHIRNKVNEVNEKMVENLKALSKASAKQRKDIRDWNNERSRKHEEILVTHVSLYAYDYGDYAKGKNHVVTYNSARGGYLDGHKSWQVLGGPKHNDEAMAMKVLNRTAGTFQVPKNASGLYTFTFSVTMDTADFNSESSMYEFVKNGTAIDGTRIYSDAGLPHPRKGRSAIYDTTPASNTIFLKLEEYDEVAVRQLMETDIPDYHVSFCGSLIHLEKVGFYLTTIEISSFYFRPQSPPEGCWRTSLIQSFPLRSWQRLSPSVTQLQTWPILTWTASK